MSLDPGPPSSTTSHRRTGVNCDFDYGDANSSSSWQLPEPSDERSSSLLRLLGVARVVLPADITTTHDFTLLRQLETTQISYRKLVSQVECISKEVTFVERTWTIWASRIPDDEDLDQEQYQKLISFCRLLLDRHCDFFDASQALSRNAAVHRMPERLWRYIQSVLEFLRKRLPESREFMLRFIQIVYGTITRLYESVPRYVGTWTEFLGDLAECMATNDISDGEIWAAVSRHWYSKASEWSPEVGRLYNRLAVSAGPDALQKLYYYNKSLCVPVAFPRAWDSIMDLFRPVLEGSVRLDPSDELFVRLHAINLSGRNSEELDGVMTEFLSTLDQSIAKRNKGWLHSGYYIAISLICSLLGYGAPNNPLQQALPASEGDRNAARSAENVMNRETVEKKFKISRTFAMQTCNIVFQRKADVNALPFLHTILVFLWYVAQHPNAMALLENELPWERVVDVLNEAIPALISEPRMANYTFPQPPKEAPRPLPEEYAMRGFAFSETYFPPDWFYAGTIEDDEKMLEPPSLGDERRQRILWVGRRLCEQANWIQWNEGSSHFTVNKKRQVPSTGSNGSSSYLRRAVPPLPGGQTGSSAGHAWLTHRTRNATLNQQVPTARNELDENIIACLNRQSFCR